MERYYNYYDVGCILLVWAVSDKRIVGVVKCSTRHAGSIVVKQCVPFLCAFRGAYPVIPK